MKNQRHHPGWVLREIRREQKRTLQFIADRIGSTPGNLSKYERGLENVSLEKFVAWCDVLGVKPSEVWLRAETDKAEGGNGGASAELVRLHRSLSLPRQQELLDFAEYLRTRNGESHI